MIIFARPHFHYDSYTDFWKLVELSGFEWCWLKEIDLKRNVTYIVSPILEPARDEWQLSWWQRKRKNARLILWDLERPKPRGGLKANRKFLARQHFDEIWHSDIQLAQDMNTRFVILGSDKRLGARPALFKRYDFSTYEPREWAASDHLGGFETSGAKWLGKATAGNTKTYSLRSICPSGQ